MASNPVADPPETAIPRFNKYSATSARPLKQAQVSASASSRSCPRKHPCSSHSTIWDREPPLLWNRESSREKSPLLRPSIVLSRDGPFVEMFMGRSVAQHDPASQLPLNRIHWSAEA